MISIDFLRDFSINQFVKKILISKGKFYKDLLGKLYLDNNTKSIIIVAEFLKNFNYSTLVCLTKDT